MTLHLLIYCLKQGKSSIALKPRSSLDTPVVMSKVFVCSET